MALWWWDDFLTRALIAGGLLALIAGPLGCFVVWRRMAYFGDTVAHAALLGVALGFVLGADLPLAVAVTSVALAGALMALQARGTLAADTLLGILAHGALATGLVVVSFIEGLRVDLMAYLFGDLLAVRDRDLLWIGFGVALALALLLSHWRALLSLTVHSDLARVEGVAALRTQFVLMLTVALVIAAAMQVVGVLLITALLIIPAAAAREVSASPERMAVVATGLAAFAVGIGVLGSLMSDAPTGPSVVVAALLLFVALRFSGAVWRAWHQSVGSKSGSDAGNGHVRSRDRGHAD
ncbi:MAG: metal ABC transporter permease [Thioalkalivibrionaceae bacterium]